MAHPVQVIHEHCDGMAQGSTLEAGLQVNNVMPPEYVMQAEEVQAGRWKVGFTSKGKREFPRKSKEHGAHGNVGISNMFDGVTTTYSP